MNGPSPSSRSSTSPSCFSSPVSTRPPARWATPFVHLSQRPDLRDRLVADPALIPSAVEEMLRYESHVDTGRRVTGRRRRAGHGVQGRGAGPRPVRLGQPGRGRVRRRRRDRPRPQPRTATWPSGSGPTAASARIWPAWSWWWPSRSSTAACAITGSSPGTTPQQQLTFVRTTALPGAGVQPGTAGGLRRPSGQFDDRPGACRAGTC